MSIYYLLARLSDSIADNAQFSPSERQELLSLFEQILQEGKEDSSFSEFWKKISSLSGQFEESEKLLFHCFPEILDSYFSLSESFRNSSFFVLQDILEGQRKDVFLDATHSSIKDKEELERYCYLVAGSVGKFWIKIVLQEGMIKENETLLKQGENYGKGLQLLNILRDESEDEVKGRSYLKHFSSQERNSLFSLCSEYLNQGCSLSFSFHQKRLQWAVLLPALMGKELLSLLLKKQNRKKVKISRKSVYRISFKALFLVLFFQKKREGNP